MITSLGAALVLTAMSGEALMERRAETPARVAMREAAEISFAGGLNRHGPRRDMILEFELAEGVDEHAYDRSRAGDDYRGLTSARVNRERYDRRRRMAAVDGFGFGARAGGGDGAGLSGTASDVGAPAPGTDRPFDVPKDEQLPADADAVAQAIVEEANGGTRVAKAMARFEIKDAPGQAIATPVPPSLVFFATGLLALRLSRRAGAA